MKHILNDSIKDYKNKYFHSFEKRCVYDIKYINMENNEEAILSITLGYMKYKSHIYGLSKKNQKCKNELFEI